MGSRLLAAVFALCVVAPAQTMSVEKLRQFLESSAPMIKQGTMSDREMAAYLEKVKLTEKLDERQIEDFQGDMRIGPKTLQALRKLAAESASLPAAAPAAPPLKPRPIPPPSSEEQAAIIDDVREYALNYSDTLPDFICTQVTRRFQAPVPGARYGGAAGGDPYWRALDTLQIRLSYFEKKEHYVVVLMNNAIVNQDYEKVGGSKAFGEFGSMMREIFEPATEARFEWDHWGLLRGKRVMAFQYHVRLDHSQYQLGWEDGKLRVTTAYHGLVEVEPDTHAVVRITANAENIPPDFPLKATTDVLDYDYQELSGHTFLLPLKSQVIMTAADGMSKLEEEFRLYRKYSAESEIKFDSEPIAPLPDDKTKETKNPSQPAAPPKN
ncbi:MAG: hypothetical protein ABSH00_09965 [Bryobacteraceae bacterium]|jgi:hypothetical protein